MGVGARGGLGGQSGSTSPAAPRDGDRRVREGRERGTPLRGSLRGAGVEKGAPSRGSQGRDLGTEAGPRSLLAGVAVETLQSGSVTALTSHPICGCCPPGCSPGALGAGRRGGGGGPTFRGAALAGEAEGSGREDEDTRSLDP